MGWIDMKVLDWTILFFFLILLGTEGSENKRKWESQIDYSPKQSLPPELVIDDFNKARTEGVYYQRKNLLGFYQGTWAQRPSYAYISKSSRYRRGTHGFSLELNYKKEKGWCGWYTRLGERDLSKYNLLSFWVKGAVGGERFDIGFLDEKKDLARMDGIYAGPVDQFIAADLLNREWQEVKVPLSCVAAEVDLTKVSAIVFWFKYEGSGTVFIDDMVVKLDPGVAVIEEENFPKTSKASTFQRALWIWKVDPVENKKIRKNVLDFCKRANISLIHLFIGNADLNQDQNYVKKLRKFIAESHKNGLKVEALSGHPTWALKDNHNQALNWMESILSYNHEVSRKERFDGITLDIEPYLTKEWGLDKKRIKLQTIQLLRRLYELRSSQENSSMTIGWAIPFFYQDEGSFAAEIADWVDRIYLMSYFDSAEKIIANSKFCLEIDKKSEKKVWITVETQDLVNMYHGANRSTFFEEGWEYMESELEKVANFFTNHNVFGGISIHYYSSYRRLRKEKIRPQNLLRLEKQEKDVLKIYSFPKINPVTIDGNLEEWDLGKASNFFRKQRVVYGRPAWKGKEDLSFQMQSMWDAENLYFAFQVADNKLVATQKGGDIWQDDHIELWLDTDLGKDFTDAENSIDDVQFGFSPGNFENLGPQTFIWTPAAMDILKQELTTASSKNDAGYVIETKIPRTLLYNENTVPMSKTEVSYTPEMHTGRQLWYTNKIGEQPKLFSPGYRLGISVEASDTDNSDFPQKCLLSTSLDRKWGDPTTFGFLELIESAEDLLYTKRQGEGDKAKPQEKRTTEMSPLDGAPSESHELISSSRSQEKDIHLVRLEQIPEYATHAHLSEKASLFGYRGRVGKYQQGSSSVIASVDNHIFYDSEKDRIKNSLDFSVVSANSGLDSPSAGNAFKKKVNLKFPKSQLKSNKKGAYKFEFQKKNTEDFCGGYIVLSGDLSKYKTVFFLVKGEKGQESFLIGMHDIISDRREDAVFGGSIFRYLPQGVETEWQVVKVPLEDFYGLDLDQAHTLVFQFDEIGEGTMWIDAPHFSSEGVVDRTAPIREKGFLLLDDFNYGDLNLLGFKAASYQKFPSTCLDKRGPLHKGEDQNKSLQLSYNKKFTGWCGYYTLLHQIDGTFKDLSGYKSLSFRVKGEEGKERFEIGMADKNWILIGDSLKAGSINNYLPGGLTRNWQEVTIPLVDFGSLDFSEIGSLVFNFNEIMEGTVYIDDIKFHLK